MIDDIRQQIDIVDRELAALFERRMGLSKQVAEYKQDKALPISDPQREQLIIQRNSKLIQDDSLRDYYVSFERKIIELSCDYQQRLMQGLKVAYAGIPGAFGHSAAMRMFPSAQHISYKDFTQAYDACVSGDCDIVVLPLENSFAGEVSAVSDLMFFGSLYISQAIEVEAAHCLLASEGSSVESIQDVLSHPQALAQCADFIREQGYNTHETPTTAAAAEIVSKRDDASVAAIGSVDCAKIYNLKVLRTHINTSSANTTRFAAFSRSLSTQHGKKSHSILMFTVNNEAGALAKALNIIGVHGFNMSCLRSRPMKAANWQYYFYLELEGNIHSSDGADMLRELTSICDSLKYIGSF